jgi:hypothetical protein
MPITISPKLNGYQVHLLPHRKLGCSAQFNAAGIMNDKKGFTSKAPEEGKEASLDF